MKTIKSHTLWAVAGLGIAAAAGYWYMNKPAAKPEGGAPVASGPTASGPMRAVGVEVAKVEALRMQSDAQAVGSLKSNQGVMLRPEVAGKVAAIFFKDGTKVRKGQTLIQLDDVLQRAEVKQASAQVSVTTANHKRNQELVSKNFIAQRVLDESAAALQVAEAQFALAQARMDRMKIIAPFDGTVGIRIVNLGDYVKDGVDLVTMEDLSTMQVDFRLPERFQNDIKVGQTFNAQIDALPGRVFKGRVSAVDPLLDANGRSVAIRGSLPNNAGVAASPSALELDAKAQPLRPGMFARVTVVFGIKENALVVPEEAIVPLGGRQFVIKAVPVDSLPADKRTGLPEDAKLVSRRAEVKLGIRRPGRVEIIQGVNAGETVVVAGQQRLQRDGLPIRVIELGAANKPAASASAAASSAAAK
jgi:membrane fusion protein, multidrug efflux system